MAKGVTDSVHYEQIAGVFREALQSEETFKPNEMEAGARAAMVAQYNAGFGDGRNEGYGDAQAECAAKHFVTTVVGDGSKVLTFNMPFKPDVLSVYCFEPTNLYKQHTIALLVVNFRTFGYIGGLSSAYRSILNLMSQPKSTKSALDSCTIDENGKVTISNLAGDGVVGAGFFRSGVTYIISAAKCTDKTDKELLNEFVYNLSDVGETVTLCKERVESVYAGASAGTNEEWNALIATKPAWTFTVM